MDLETQLIVEEQSRLIDELFTQLDKQQQLLKDLMDLLKKLQGLAADVVSTPND